MRRSLYPLVGLALILASSACTSVHASTAPANSGYGAAQPSPEKHQPAQGGQANADGPGSGTYPIGPVGPPGRPCLPWVTEESWRHGAEAATVFQQPPRPSCPYSIKLAVAADDAWDVFVGGQKLVPTNGSQENDWRTPARYETVVQGTGSSLVIGIHARDVSGVLSGVLASVRVQRLSPPSSLPPQVIPTDSIGWYAFQPSSQAPTPPANWNTAPYLPFDPATEADWASATLASACTGVWGGNTTFLNNWTAASGGAPPTFWIWEQSCEANATSWRKENWYRLEVHLDYCPSETPPPLPCCTWTITGHGAADGLFDIPPTPGCTTDASSSPATASCIDRVGCGWIPSLCKYSCGFDFWSWECD
jgi:hypothetical protein